MAERLRKLVAGHSFTVCGNEVRITMSIGVAPLTGAEICATITTGPTVRSIQPRSRGAIKWWWQAR